MLFSSSTRTKFLSMLWAAIYQAQSGIIALTCMSFSKNTFVHIFHLDFQVMSHEHRIFQFHPICVPQLQFRVKTIWVMIC